MSFALAGLVSVDALALEEPGFSVIASADGTQFRRYSSYLVAETTVSAPTGREQAANIGFRRLFDYISGANQAQSEIAMTAPVRQQAAGTEIAMTVPVRQETSASGWTIAFVLPAQFNEATVPAPTDAANPAATAPTDRGVHGMAAKSLLGAPHSGHRPSGASRFAFDISSELTGAKIALTPPANAMLQSPS